MNELITNRLRRLYGESLPVRHGTEPHLQRSLSHVLENPGSMVRPEIIYRMCRAYGLPNEAAENLAIAMEYFHTASLLVDDLPCMDDATERRGDLCVHVEHGESGAILTALALVNRAYALTWRAASAARPETARAVLEFLEARLGVDGLLNGQSMDLHYGSLPHTLETVEEIAAGKTVALIRLTLVLPAILGEAAAAELECLERLATSWGLSYQLVDDVKDTLQTSEQSGKTVSRDQALDRPNAAMLLGLDDSADRLRMWMENGDVALNSLLSLRPELMFLKELRAEQGREAMSLMQELCAVAVGEPA